MLQKNKKAIGWALLIIAIIFIDPLPSFTDSLTLPIYSAYSGESVVLNNLSSVYLDYTIWCLVVGGIILFFAMQLLGWDFKKLFKKLNIGKYKIALGISVLTVLLVGLLDVWSANSGIFGNFTQYTYGQFQGATGYVNWWNLFFKFALIIFALPAICYYAFFRRDKSEALGVFLFSFILYFGGLSDIAYFIFAQIPIPMELPWLMGSPFISFVSTNLGFETVTSSSLIVSVIFASLIAILTSKLLKDWF